MVYVCVSGVTGYVKPSPPSPPSTKTFIYAGRVASTREVKKMNTKQKHLNTLMRSKLDALMASKLARVRRER